MSPFSTCFEGRVRNLLAVSWGRNAGCWVYVPTKRVCGLASSKLKNFRKKKFHRRPLVSWTKLFITINAKFSLFGFCGGRMRLPVKWFAAYFIELFQLSWLICREYSIGLSWLCCSVQKVKWGNPSSQYSHHSYGFKRVMKVLITATKTVMILKRAPQSHHHQRSSRRYLFNSRLLRPRGRREAARTKINVYAHRSFAFHIMAAFNYAQIDVVHEMIWMNGYNKLLYNLWMTSQQWEWIKSWQLFKFQFFVFIPSTHLQHFYSVGKF